MAKDKTIDITKTGPAGYRALQQANAEPYTSANDEITRLRGRFKKQIDPYSDISQNVATPLLSDKDRWGNSMWDEQTATIEDLDNLSDIRAENQWGIAQLGAGLAKGALLAGTTFVNGTLGLAAGVLNSIDKGKLSGLWDNEVTNAMDSVNKWSEEALPNYYTQEEQEAPWYNNIFTTNFWGDKFLKNLGFTVGAFYSGGIYSKGLTGLMELINAGRNTTNVVTSLVGAGISAVNEGSIEALNAANDYESKMMPMISQQYQNNIARAKELYDLTGDVQTYNATLKQEEDKYNKAIAELQEDKAKVGNITLGLNIPLLTASNLFQFGRLYANGTLNNARRISGIKGVIGNYSVAGKSKLGKAATILGGGLAEGSEEMGQGLASDTSQNYYAKDFNNYYRNLNNVNGNKETLDWVKSFGETLATNFSDTGTGGAWEEFAIGALTGLLGMPSFRGVRSDTGKWQSPVYLRESAVSKWKDLTKEQRRNQTVVDYLNNRTQNSEETKNYYQGIGRHLNYQGIMDDAARRNDKFDYKNAEHAQLVSDIEMFYKAGRLEDLKTIIGDSFDISDTNIEAIIESTKNDNNLSPYIDNKGNPLPKEEIIAKIKEARQNTLDTLDSYITNREKIDKMTNQTLSEENLNELTWMATQLDNWESRAASMGDTLKTTISKVYGLLGQQKNAQELILLQEGQQSADLTEAYKKADSEIRSINKAINNLALLQQLDGKTVANTLSKNKDVLTGISMSINSIDANIMSAEDKESAKLLLDDLSRIGDASKLYAKKFTEYLLNPQKQNEDHAKIDEEKVKDALHEEKKERVTAASTASTFGDVTSLIEEGKVNSDDLDSAPNSAAKDYNKASLFRKKALELINNSDSDFKEQLLEMVESKFKNSTSYSDLANSSLLPDTPESALLLDAISQETMLNEYKNFTEEVVKKITAGYSQKKDTIADPQGNTKNVGNDSSSTIEDGHKKLNIENINKAIDALDEEQQMKELLKQKVKNIAKYIEELKSDITNAALIHTIQTELSNLTHLWKGSSLDPLIDEFLKSTAANNKEFSSQEDIVKEHEDEEKQYPPTAVTGILKTVIPQFDLDAKKNGVLIDFVGDNRNQGYAYVYNRLKEIVPESGKNAFEYVNEGNIKVGDEVVVRYEEATDEHPELLALYHNNTLINYLNTDESIAGIKEIKEKAKKKELVTVTVTKIMDGSFGYDRTKMQSIADILGSDNAYIGIANNIGTLTTNSNKPVEKHFGFSSSSTLGKVYLLLPNSKGTMTPKQVYVKHFNRDEYPLTDNKLKDTPIGKEIISTLTELSQGPFNTSLANKIYVKLTELFYIDNNFHFNIEERFGASVLTIGFNDQNGKRINRRLTLEGRESEAIAELGVPTPTNTEKFKEDPSKIFDFALNALYDANLPFNINAKQLEQQGDEYANKLAQSHVLGTYLTSNKMQGSWLIFNEETPDSSRRDTAYDKKRKEENKEIGVSVTLEGKQYYVKGGTIYYNGSIIDLADKAQQILDLAYIQESFGEALYGVNQHNGVVLIVDSKGKRGYSRKLNRYLNRTELEKLEAILNRDKTNVEKTLQAVHNLNEDQKKVIRDTEGNPDTSNNNEGRSVYHIKEDDGNVHEYERIHTIIGSNYIGPSSGNSATNRGQVVDDFNRFYLNALKAGDVENITKPENLSEKAYNTLKKALNDLYVYTQKYDLTLVTDRIVVFNNYNGNRIAGELDVFAYNPTTGDIVIFDFKTSKYTTKQGYDKIVNPNYYTRSTKEQHTLQLSGYAKIIEDKYSVNVKTLIILPYRIIYGKGDSISELYAEPYIGLNKDSNVFGLQQTQRAAGPIKIQWYSEKNNTYQQAMGTPVSYNGQTYYIMAANNTYALVAPNGIVIGANDEFGDSNISETESLVKDFLDSNYIAISERLKTSPLDSSPYGNTVVIVKPSLEKQKTRENANKLDNLQSSNSDIKEEKASKEMKATQPVITKEEENTPISQRNWDSLNSSEKQLVQSTLGIDYNEAKNTWDSLFSEGRDTLLGC